MGTVAFELDTASAEPTSPGVGTQSSSLSRTLRVTCSFPDRDSAERAYAQLRSKGYTEQDIHLFMTEQTHSQHFQPPRVSRMRSGSSARATSGSGRGLPGAGTMLTVPGIGLVAIGHLASAVARAATGADEAGMRGSLVRAGIAEDHAGVYERDLRAGRIVLGVNARHEDDARHFEDAWRATGEHVCR